MESRHCRLFLKGTFNIFLGILILFTGSLQAAEPLEQKAEQIILPDLDRREIKEAKIDTEDFEVGFHVGLLSIEDFGVNGSAGLRFAYHISENFFTELAIGGSEAGETSYEVLGGSVRLLTDDQRLFAYYNISLGYNLFAGEAFFGKRAYNSDLYLIAGVGNTVFNEDDHATVSLGVGYRFIPKDWFAFHIDFRDHMFNSDILGADKVTHNLEISAGVTFFF